MLNVGIRCETQIYNAVLLEHYLSTLGHSKCWTVLYYSLHDVVTACHYPYE